MRNNFRSGAVARPLARLLGLALLAVALGTQAADALRYADEDRDWGVPATNQLKQPPYHAPTPLAIPGARVVHTRELHSMLAGPDRPVLVDVLSGEGHETLAGAVWLGGAGRGEHLNDPVQSELVPLLARLTAGDKSRPIAFFCASSQCWLSYNAALRAVAAGWTRVYWYRGGIDAWAEANLPMAKTIADRTR